MGEEVGCRGTELGYSVRGRSLLQMAGSELVGSDLVGSDMVGSDMVGSE